MGELIRLNEGRYKMRLYDGVWALKVLCIYYYGQVNIDDVVDYTIKNLSKDFQNFLHLAVNIALDMESADKIKDTEAIRKEIVNFEISKALPDDCFIKYEAIAIDSVKILNSFIENGDYKISKNVLDYFEVSLTRNILKQAAKVIFRKLPINTLAKIKISTITSDALYESKIRDRLGALEYDMIEYFCNYNFLKNIIIIENFEDYIMITMKNLI